MTRLSASPVRFQFPYEVVEAFTWGDCGYLAVALSNATGLDIATASFDTRDAWRHAGVWIDDQHILDIKGIHHYQDWLADWEWTGNLEGYEEYGAYRWKTIEFVSIVLEEPRVYPNVDLDQVVKDVLEQINY